MGGFRACAYMGGCSVARPKSPLVHPYSPVRATRELPRVTVVLTGVRSNPRAVSGAGRQRESLIPDSTKAASGDGVDRSKEVFIEVTERSLPEPDLVTFIPNFNIQDGVKSFLDGLA